MKNIFLSLSLIAASSVAGFAQSEYNVMTIHKTDNSTVTIKVDDVQKITFDVVNTTLTNQYDKNGKYTAIGSVVEGIGATGRTYYVYDEAGVTTSSESAPLQIWVSEANVGKSIDLATATEADFKLTASGMTVDNSTLKGTLKISKDKFNKNVTIALASNWGADQVLRANYTGAFASVREASNTYSITFDDGYVENGKIVPLVSVASDGGSYGFGFGSVENASAAQDFREGNYGIRFYVPAGWTTGTTYDIAQEANKGNLTFEVFYYPSGQTVTMDDTATGTICVLKNADGSYYFNYNIQFDGTTFAGDYSGTPTAVASLDKMAPAVEVPNQMVMTSASETTLGTYAIETVQHRVDADGLHYFYFIINGTYSSDVDSKSKTPVLMLTPSLVANGDYDLTTQANESWSLYYYDFALGADGSYKYYLPTNGTMSIDINGDTYEFTIKVKNTYKNPWGSGTAGSGSTIDIHYKGTLSTYTGTSANTL